ncbi:hypoxanthine phosphoribosyltransferase [Enterococcus faecalis TX1467]|nr:hypoxanthine phosphoribosyltransferase [Enterococcus faecalis TX1467]
MIEKDIEKVLISKEEILAKSAELGKQLTEEYQGKNPLVVGILKGAVPFMADLTREINTYLELDFMDVSSYGNATVSSGEVKIVKDLDTNVEGRHILIVEDIIDSGRTLAYLVDLFRYRKAASVKIVTLLDKPEGRVVDIKADYVGFDVPNEFVVGYGLDYAETYRNLPYIGVLSILKFTNQINIYQGINCVTM